MRKLPTIPSLKPVIPRCQTQCCTIHHISMCNCKELSLCFAYSAMNNLSEFDHKTDWWFSINHFFSEISAFGCCKATVKHNTPGCRDDRVSACLVGISCQWQSTPLAQVDTDWVRLWMRQWISSDWQLHPIQVQLYGRDILLIPSISPNI